MPEQSDFPDEWSCTSENKRVRVEVRYINQTVQSGVPGSTFNPDREYVWIEIPTMSVEQWVEKGDAAAIQRTAKVKFPLEWGMDDGTVVHNSPRRLVKASTESQNEPFGLGRIWFQTNRGEWKLIHMGWIGGVGPSGDGSTGKFWVYDFAELISSVPIGTTFSNPSVRQALEHVARLTNDNTPIPVEDVTYIPPNAEELYAKTTQDGEFEFDTAVSVEESENVLNGQFSPFYSRSGVMLSGISQTSRMGAPAGSTYDASGTVDTSQGGESRSDAIGEVASGNVGSAIGTALDPDDGTSSKKFVENHDTLRDVYQWLQSKIGGKIHFEPNPHSVTMTADVSTSRRVFAQDEVVENHEGETALDVDWEPSLFGIDFGIDEEIVIPYSWHETISVLRNDALFEMKPINTLQLRGDTSKSYVTEEIGEGTVETTDRPLQLEGIESVSKVFPVIKLQVPSLLQAAEGNELAPEVVESDANELDEAEKVARKELTESLEEATEGSIILDGEPNILPYDRVDSYEVCDGFVTYEQTPVSYEIESVKHTKESGGTYKTELNVSLWANEKNIETVRKEMVEVNQGEAVG